MRIVGGTASGRKIQAPSGLNTRPTAERVREAVFNSLARWILDASVLDLFGGSGALSLEAISWGAKLAMVCEVEPAAAKLIRANAAELGMQAKVHVMNETAETAVRRLGSTGERFDLAFCDPPWDRGLSQEVRENVHKVLKRDAILVVEHPSTTVGPHVDGLIVQRTRRYGRTCVTFYRPIAVSAQEEAGST